MSPSSKEKIREDVQEAMAEKEEGNNVKIPVDVWWSIGICHLFSWKPHLIVE